MANKYLYLAGLKAYNGALLGTQIGSLVTYDSTNSKFVRTTFNYNSETGVVTKTTADAIATNGSVASGNTALVTGDAVYQAIQGITEPMIFKGAISALPTGSTASPIKVGYTYKLTADITDIPVASGEDANAKAGDTIICSTADSSTGTATYWAIIPSGDEPSGTVTDITIAGKTEAITNSGQSDAGVVTLTVNAATNPQQGDPTFGVVAVGDNITNTNGVISVATATDDELGVVQIGDNILIDNGVISVAEALGENLGLVREGDNVSIGFGGTINVATGASNTLGLVQADGTTIATDIDGVLSINTISYTAPAGETSDIDALFG
jgi:hypothetical protein